VKIAIATSIAVVSRSALQRNHRTKSMIAEVEKAVSTKNARIMGDNCEGPIRAFLARYLPKVFKAATGKFRTSEGHQLVVHQEREKPHQVGREMKSRANDERHLYRGAPFESFPLTDPILLLPANISI
jgi:hypothetical protein